MERIFKHKDKEIMTKVRMNATSTTRIVTNHFLHDEERKTFRQHIVECLVDGKIISSRPCEDHELEKTITEVENKAKEWVNEQQPRVDPTAEKLKKMGFV